MGKHVAKMIMTVEILLDKLHLPEDTQILDVRKSNNRLDYIEFLIEHNDLDEIKEGYEIPIVNPTFITLHQSVDKFNDWYG